MWLLYLIPKNWLSRMVGRLVYWRLPAPFAQWSIRIFGRAYNINFAEAEKPIEQYPSIGDFFVRKLKPGARELSESPLVHPADGRISQIGEILDGKCVQAKGKFYSVPGLCEEPAYEGKFKGGMFVTYYLCPTDYHRVHSPVDGVIKSAKHIPGSLWPVNQWSTAQIENLFVKNERVVLEIESRIGNCLLVFVGATNVGEMRMSFDSEIVTNQKHHREPRVQIYDPPIPIEKGQELGQFHMGSTVVMIYAKNITLQRADWESFKGQSVKFGQAFL